jgi:hypothetical protein
MWRVSGPILISLALTGCGARAELGGEGALDDSPLEERADGLSLDPGPGAPPGAEPEPEPEPEPGGALRFEPTALSECVPGFRRSQARGRTCSFLVAERCYEDQRSACACACPSSGSSVCVAGGLLSPLDQPLPVSCR